MEFVDIAGDCIGVKFSPRGRDDQHALINLCVEDDEIWHKSLTVSSFWIDDMIDVLQKAKIELETNFNREADGFGYEFRQIKE